MNPKYYIALQVLSNLLVVEFVPRDCLYSIPLGKGEIVQEGNDVTIVSYGAQIYILEEAIKESGKSCELVDLRTIIPWDKDLILESVKKTKRLLIVHEAPVTGGVGAEIAAYVQEKLPYDLLAPVHRLGGWDTPFPHIFEYFYLPNQYRCLEAINKITDYK